MAGDDNMFATCADGFTNIFCIETDRSRNAKLVVQCVLADSRLKASSRSDFFFLFFRKNLGKKGSVVYIKG